MLEKTYNNVFQIANFIDLMMLSLTKIGISNMCNYLTCFVLYFICNGVF